MSFLYNLAMLSVDAVAIGGSMRHRRPIVWCAAMACAAAVAILLGGVLGVFVERSLFGVLRLWAYGVFLHAVLLLWATAVLWRHAYRAIAVVAALAACTLMVVAADTFLVEPTWLEVTHRRIASPKIHKPIRIVVIADLQADELRNYECDVLRRAMDERPDILLFAGDYLEVPWPKYAPLARQLHEFLAELHVGSHAKAFAVRGNVDPGEWRTIFNGLEVTMVTGRESFDLGDLTLTCLPLEESADRSLAVANPSPDRFHVVLGHRPDFALGDVDADLLVAGHTHGGQVRLPWFGALMTLCRVPRAWAAGLTALPSGANLLVSRGIGMERDTAPRLRFLCRPELCVIEVVPASKPTGPRE